MLGLLFGMKGRLGRVAYAILVITAAVLTGVITVVFSYSIFVTDHPSTGSALIAAAFLAVLLWMLIAATSKRLHDFDAPGAVAALTMIPVANLLLFAVLCFWPGDASENKHGPVPT